MIRVGVTGHRDLAAEASLTRRLADAVRSIRSTAPVAEVEIWSSLAEGADRLAASLVPAEAGRLVVVLPLEPDDYRDDFVTAASRAEFDRLLTAADEVEIIGPDEGGSRESAYERAGRSVIAHCDVLLALWDGERSRGRGGTAQMVEEARELGRDIVVIPSERATT